jgi:hypothetical protein
VTSGVNGFNTREVCVGTSKFTLLYKNQIHIWNRSQQGAIDRLLPRGFQDWGLKKGSQLRISRGD